MGANQKLSMQLRRELDRELKQIKADYFALRDGNPFVLWFAEARITGERAKAMEGVVGQPGDMGVDALYVDEGLNIVHAVQGKKHDNLNANDSNDLLKFARRATDLWSPKFHQVLKSMENKPGIQARKRLLEAHSKLHANSKPAFLLKMYFATTGRVTPTKEREARRIARASGDTELEVVAGHEIPVLFHEWQIGTCPPLPEMEIRVNGKDTIFHEAGRLQGWIFTATADEIVGLYNKAKERLFARNIRGYRGDTTINDAILDSAKHSADRCGDRTCGKHNTASSSWATVKSPTTLHAGGRPGSYGTLMLRSEKRPGGSYLGASGAGRLNLSTGAYLRGREDGLSSRPANPRTGLSFARYELRRSSSSPARNRFT